MLAGISRKSAEKMQAVIRREICGWPNISRKMWSAGRTCQKIRLRGLILVNVCAVCKDAKSRGRSVKEWLMPLSSREMNIARYDSVLVQPLSWEIPSLQRLWLGESTEDKHMRMMVLLQCFDCYDNGDSLLLNQTYVQPRFFVLCLVLR